MDTSQLKRYAIQARRDFIAAVTARAKRIGAGPDGMADFEVRGDYLIIGEQTFPSSYKGAFGRLGEEIRKKGFEHVIDEIAYTWFNRLVALRYMEIHDYLPHGLRVLSSRDSNTSPEVMRNPLQLDFSTWVNKELIRELFEAGNREEELYRALLIAQCNELNAIMPFLFEKVSDLSELLLPDNLLASDSIIRTLCSEIKEDEWQKGVEIIGWIYQFYISEKKDEVIGKVVKSEDIPAATQLFTPNWIVKYLVQNSIGSYWLGTYPESALKAKMEYYIEPAKQESEVEAELKKITPKEIDPESITVIDPACGSGHILVEAYNLLKEIYLERGYRPKDIPRLILEKNLFGLDIDERAAQLASLALLLRARADDRSIFSSDHPVQLNIREIVAPDFKIEDAVQMLTGGKNIAVEQMTMPFVDTSPKQGELGLKQPDTLTPEDVREFFELFAEAKTFGSLIQIPENLKGKLSTIEKQAVRLSKSSNFFEWPVGAKTLELVKQAQILAGQYDACVMNPPYMGSKFYVPSLKAFVAQKFEPGKADLYGCFAVRGLSLLRRTGFMGMITIPNWMFLSTFEDFRRILSGNTTIRSLIHNGRGVWGSDFGSCSFIIQGMALPSFKGTYRRLFDQQGSVAGNEELRCRFLSTTNFFASFEQHSLIPGSPVAYWLSDKMRQVFKDGTPLEDIAEPRQGMATADNNRFLRCWWEVDNSKIGLALTSSDEALKSKRKWFPYNKGGDFRKWYGNNQFVVNWENDGYEIRNFADESGYIRSRAQNTECFFKPGITWTFISSSKFGVRLSDRGFLFDVAGSTVFPEVKDIELILGLLCSPIAFEALKATNPTLNFQVGNVGQIPVLKEIPISTRNEVVKTVSEAVSIARSDWDMAETSWDFKEFFLKLAAKGPSRLSDAFELYKDEMKAALNRLRLLEIQNNQILIAAYGLDSDLSPDVPEDEVTLRRPDPTADMKAFVSYSIGCMMGRYSLDAPGLIYANSGNKGFDPSKYRKFPADSDGIIPLMDYPWFEDDATARFISFLKVAWSEDTLPENLKFVADSLDSKSGETPEETIQRYFSDSFFKDHLKTYKKRPIYWLFSSGKEGAFQALVYLHRYNETTLSKMRTDYVLPLQGKLANEERRLESQIDSAGSPAEKNRHKKTLEKLKKKSIELKAFDEKLHHLADQRISLDLDEGVKVNYAKLAPLLACVKDVTGGSDE